ncbi:MAG: carbohydrate ABC transporter permease [Clostridia bacterium]|nr:carbohydrate ABC transporter permease [Clostridia bacterium]
MSLKMNKKKGAVRREGVISDLDYKYPKTKILYWAIFAAMCVAAAICLAPPLWVILSSVKDTKEFYQIPPTLVPHSYDFSKIGKIWSQFAFGKYYMNTIFLTVYSIAWSIFSNGLAGYVLSKIKPRGSSVVFALILASMMIPTSVSMVPVYKNIINFPIGGFNLINTFLPMILMTGCNAFMTIVYKSFFDGIPTALLEAAKIDGCGEIRSFAHIVLPLSKPIIFTAIILAFNHAWADFFWPNLVLKDRSTYTVIVEVFHIKTSIPQDQALMILSFAIIPPAIMFLIFQKNIMQGLTMSGIKG